MLAGGHCCQEPPHFSVVVLLPELIWDQPWNLVAIQETSRGRYHVLVSELSLAIYGIDVGQQVPQQALTALVFLAVAVAGN